MGNFWKFFRGQVTKKKIVTRPRKKFSKILTLKIEKLRHLFFSKFLKIFEKIFPWSGHNFFFCDPTTENFSKISQNFDPRPYVEGRISAPKYPFELKIFCGALMGKGSPQNFLELKRTYGGRATTHKDLPIFRPKIAKSRFWPIFWKMEKWPFWGCSKTFVRCAFELKFLWGLSLALKSSHINFQLKRLGWSRYTDLQKSPFWPSKASVGKKWPFSDPTTEKIFKNFDP